MSTEPIVLKIKGHGHIPALKNAKMWVSPKGRRPFLMTKPKVQKWMEAVIEDLQSQLHSLCQIRGLETAQGVFAPSKIALLSPLDDSREWIVKEGFQWQQCSKGEEGAIITITPL